MGDETTPYLVTDYEAKTIVEFINEVLENKSEWGYIAVKDISKTMFCWNSRIEYRYGKLLNEIPDSWKQLNIKKIIACGGWTRMDYLITPFENLGKSNESK